MTDRTYEGGCHCGLVRFKIVVPEDEHTAVVCNCSVCTKKGIVHIILPRSRFQILSGEDELSVYTFNTHVAKHMFCRTCGIHPFYVPRSHPEDIDVNLRCLDNAEDIARFSLRDFDGRNWEANIDRIR